MNLFLFVTANAVFAQIDVDSCLPDRFFPESGNCGYDVGHYDLNFEWEEAQNLLKGDVTVSLRNLVAAESISLDFSNHLIVSEVLVEGVPTAFNQEEMNLVVRGDFQADQQYRIRVIYSGIAEEKTVLQQGSSPLQPSAGPFCILSEPNLAAGWFPGNDSLKDKATFSVQVTVPSKYAAASNGRLEEILFSDGSSIRPEAEFTFRAGENDAEKATYRYEIIDPIAPYLFTVCISEFELIQQQTREGLLQLDFYEKELKERKEFQSWAEMMPEMLQCFEPLFGKYPFQDSGSVVIQKSFGGALETQTRSVYGSDMVFAGEHGFSHELAHQWIGDSVGIADWSDLWIKEGFATFAEAIWQGCAGGEADFWDTLYQNYAIMGDVMMRYEHTAAIARQYLQEDVVQNAEFKDIDQVITGINLICDREIALSELELAGELPINGEAFWELAVETCRNILIEPLKQQSINSFFELDPSFGLPVYGPDSITNDYNDMYSRNPYSGGALVYLALYAEMGEEKFYEAIRMMVERYQNASISTAQFVEHFSEVAEKDLSSLIDHWLQYQILPDYPLPETTKDPGTYRELVNSIR